MRRWMLGIAMAAVATTAGCKTLARQAFANPVVEVKDVRVKGVGTQGGSLDLVLDVYNPNEYRIDARRISYSVVVDSSEIATGEIERLVTLTDKGHSEIVVPVNFTYAAVQKAVMKFALRGSLDYRVAATDPAAVLADGSRAFVSRYALGRDYHRLLRNRLQRLVDRMALAIGPFDHRVFADSAPVAEVELARRAGLGWRGKHSLLLDREAGSYFFLGEILTGLTLPPDSPVTDHCGDCSACIDACPTDALVAPKQLDARRCISYLTIEHKTALPESLRASLGNRIYGCDDCQLACPWNRFAPLSNETDFAPRHGLDDTALVDLFAWTEDEFEKRLAGSPIRRIGYERWLRNLAVALGNAPSHPTVVAALKARADHPSELVREHVAWALRRHGTLPADS